MDGEIYVVLGCFGRTDDGFISCLGIQNPILVVNSSMPFYSEIMDYFDNLQLFDKMMLDANAIRHFIFNLQERYSTITGKLWSEKMFHLYQKFILDHKNCGLYIRLDLPE